MKIRCLCLCLFKKYSTNIQNQNCYLLLFLGLSISCDLLELFSHLSAFSSSSHHVDIGLFFVNIVALIHFLVCYVEKKEQEKIQLNEIFQYLIWLNKSMYIILKHLLIMWNWGENNSMLNWMAQTEIEI